jgi:hypothetical protein
VSDVVAFLRGPAGAAGLILAAALLAGCGAKHTVGDTVIYDPEAEAEDGQNQSDRAPQEGEGQDGKVETTESAPEKGQFVEAKGTGVGGEDWVAEIRKEGRKLWLVSPFDEATTYAMVRAATLLQGLKLETENFDDQRLSTTYAYKAWHGDDEGGIGLTMKILTKGFGKDARYRFKVSVERLEGGGSRVTVRQLRQVMEEEPHEDVGDWVKADKPDPAITRKYLEGIRRAMGE